MEKIDKGKDKKHTDKLTSNSEDKTPYITLPCQIEHALDMRLCSSCICEREGLRIILVNGRCSHLLPVVRIVKVYQGA